MKKHALKIASVAVGAALAATLTMAVDAPIPPVLPQNAFSPPPAPTIPKRPQPVARTTAPLLEEELPSANESFSTGFGARSSFTGATPSPEATTLNPPATLTYSGNSPALLVTDTGSNRGVESIINNTKNTNSAFYGTTNGGGAGVTGYNTGTKGPAGKFVLENSGSSHPAITTTTNGKGPALLATITKSNSEEPAILGQNTGTTGYGVGIEGQGNAYGVEGYGTYGGIYGSAANFAVTGETSAGIALYGTSETGIGLYSSSDSYYGIYALSTTGIGTYSFSESNDGVYAATYSGAAVHAEDATKGYGVLAHSANGFGIFASSDTYYAIWGQSKNEFAVVGEDAGGGAGVYGSSASGIGVNGSSPTGTGVYGYSGSGYAGYFDGKVGATSYVTVSDRNTKTAVKPVDGKAILKKVSQLPVSSWEFKTDPGKSHVGPMAQDFHAAFGLDGDDDKHINLTDFAGVSLAAIQELNVELKQKDAEIAALKNQKDAEIVALQNQLKTMTETLTARMTMLEKQQKQAVAAQTISLRKASKDRGGQLGDRVL